MGQRQIMLSETPLSSFDSVKCPSGHECVQSTWHDDGFHATVVDCVRCAKIYPLGAATVVYSSKQFERDYVTWQMALCSYDAMVALSRSMPEPHCYWLNDGQQGGGLA